MNMDIRASLRVVVMLATAAASFSALGATVTWDAGGDGVNWSSAANWTGNSLPTVLDDVVITTAGGSSLQVDMSPTVRSITIQNGKTVYIQAGQVLTVSNTSTINTGAVLRIENSTFTGSGDLMVNGDVVLDGGTLSGSGVVSIAGGMEVDVDTNASELSRTTTNNGTVIYVDVAPGPNFIFSGATFTNNATFQVSTDHGIDHGLGSPILNNSSSALFVKNFGSGGSSIDVTVNNAAGGIVQANAGTLALNNGGSASGTYSIGSSGLIALTGGTFTTSATTTLAGTGGFTVAGATLDAGVNLTLPRLLLSSGSISGAGTVHLSGNFTWSGGTISGGGSRVLDSTSTPTISCAAGNCVLDGATLQLQASTTFSASSNPLVFSNGATLTIDPGKTLSVTNNGDFTSGSGGGSIVNNGTIRKPTFSGTSTIGVAVALSGTSTVKIDNGVVQFGGGASVATGATLDIAGGSQLEVTGGLFQFNTGTVSMPGSGDFVVSAGTLRVPTGITVTIPKLTLQTSGVIDGGGTLILSGTSSWTGGTMGSVAASGGITRIDSGNTLNIGGAAAQSLTQTRQLLNNGTVNYNSAAPNILTMSGNASITNNSVLDLKVDSDINLSGSALIENFGSMTKSLGPGTSNVFPRVENNSGGTVSVTVGTLELWGGGTAGGAYAISSVLALSSGIFTVASTSTVTGAGTLVISGATADISSGANVTWPNLNLQGGTISGAGTLHVSGTFGWFGGTISGGGPRMLDSTSTPTISCSAGNCVLDGAALQLHTSATFSASSNPLVFSNGASLTIDPGKALSIVTLSGNFTSGAGSGSIINNGTIWKKTVAGTSTIGVPVTLSGTSTVDIDTGTLQFGADASVATGATLDIASGSQLEVTGGLFQFNSGTVSMPGSGDFTVSSGTLRVPTGITMTIPRLTLQTSGVIDGGGTLILSGTANWLGGTMGSAIAPGGVTRIDSGNGLNITPSIAASLTQAREVLNNGTLAYGSLGANILTMSGNSKITNNNTINFNDGTIGLSGSALIDNFGSMTKVAGTGTTAIVPPVNNNNGATVSAPAGTISLSGGGIAAGVYDVTSGATLALAGGTFTVASTSTVTGTGALSINGGTADAGLGVDATWSRVILSAGSITGAGILRVSNDLTFSGGTIAGSGMLFINNGATMEIGPASVIPVISRSMTNAGTMTVLTTCTVDVTFDGATLTNTGTIDIQNGHNIKAGVGSPILNNNSGGILRKSTNSGITEINFTVNNAAGATIESQIGHFYLNGGGTDSGAFSILGAGSQIRLGPAANTFTMSGSPTVAGAGTLAVVGATLDAGSGVDVTVPNLLLSFGTITGAGAVRVSGDFTWSAGTISGSGPRVLNSTSGPAFPCDLANCVLDGAALQLQASGTYSASTNPFTFSNGASLVIDPAKTLTISNNGAFTSGGGAASSIINNGTIWKVTAAGTSAIGVPVTLSGTSTVDIDAGTLQFGADTSVATGATLDIAATGKLEVTGGVFLFNSGPVTMPGSGTFSVSAGTLRVPSSITMTIPKLTLEGSGIIDGAGTLILSGTSTWDSGSMGSAAAPGGITLINPGSTLNMVNFALSNTLTQGRELQNAGTINYGGGSSPLTMSGSSKITNNAAFHLTADRNINLSGGATIDNNGTLDKSGGSGTSTLFPPVNNAGTVSATSGTLALAGGGASSGGSFTVTAPANLSFASGTHSMSGGGSISGTGTLSFSGGAATVGIPVNVSTLNMNAGTATLDVTSSAGAFTMTGGTLGGSGTLTLNNGGTWSGGTMSGSGTTIGHATLTISAPVTLNTRTVQNSGTFSVSGNVSGSGTIVNQGIFNTAANVTIGTAFNNNGQVSTTNVLTLAGDGTHSGSFNVVSPGTLSFSAGTHSMTGGVFSGSGTLSFDGATATVGIPVNVGTLSVTAGTATLNAAAGANAFTMNGGTLGGSGTLTLNNGGTWSGGTMSGSGTTVNPVTKTLGISAPVMLNSRTLQNDGTVNLGGDVSGSGVIANNGTLNTLGNLTIGAVLNNSGQVATSDVLLLAGGGTHTGSFTVTAPGNLVFSSGTHSISGGSIGGTGTLSFTGATATVGVPLNVGGLSVSGGTATLNGSASAGAFTMIAGTLSGSATLTLTNGGTWTGGTMSGSGTTINPSAKTISIPAPVTLNRTLQNNGTLSVGGNVSGSGTIDNQGTINAAANVTIAAAVNNSGQIATSTLLSLGGNGVHSGTFTAIAPGVIDFNGGTQTISGTLAGTGTVRFSGAAATVSGTWSGMPIEVSGGSAALNSSGTIPALTLSGGTLTGSGNVTVSGPSTWSGGTIAGSGALTFGNGATITMTGANAATLSRPLLNQGTINFAAASSAMVINGVPITNSGTLDIQSASQDILVTAGTPPFVNSGTLKKSAGAGAVQFAAPLMNTGVVEIDAGTLNVSGTYGQSAGTTDVRPGATLQTATLALNGGSLVGNGTIAGTVDNHAVVAPGASPGTLTINGDYVQAPDGTLDIQLGGTTAGTEYDRLIVSGTVTLDGTLNVSTINSFVPAIGNQFQIFTYGARSNVTTFATVNGLAIDATTVLVPIYGVNDLQLLTNNVQADLFASVSAPLSAANGSAFAYTVNIFNQGGSNATGVNFTATLPPNVTFNSASGAVCSGAPNLVCTIGALGNQSTAAVVLNVTANGTGAAPISVITGGNEPDPNSANNTASASTSIGTVADLRIAATGTASTLPGSRVIYNITVTNSGPDAASTVTVSAAASPGLTFSGNSGACSGSFPCTLAALSSGQSATIVSAWDISTTAAGSVQLTFNAASPASDPNSPDNSASVTTLIGTCPAIIIGAPTELRSGSSAAAAATPFVGATFNWSISNGTIDSGAGTNSITFTAGTAGTATLAVQVIGAGCTLGATFPVTVKPRQTCVGTATPSEPAAGTTTAEAVVTFRWSAIEGASGYRLWLQDGDAPAQNLGTAIDTSLTRVIPPGVHRWYVETLFDGCASHESDHLALTILAAQDCASNGAPQLNAPANDTTATTATVAFSWNAIAKAIEYELWLAPAGGVPTLIRTTTATSYTATVPPGRLEWYVRAIFGGCAPTESAHRTFTYTLPPDCTNQRPLLIAPADGERLTSPVSFEWRAVSGATSYELSIDGVLAATTTSPHASGIAVPLDERRWQVRARLGEGCGALDSAEGRFAVIPPPSSCTPLDAPAVTAPGQISSGVTGRIQWTFVAGATAYVVEISTDSQFSPGATSSSIVTTRELPFTFTNESSAPTARYLRVHAVDTKCVVQGSGPFSPVAVLKVLPRTGSDAVALLSDPADVQYTLSIAADLAGSSFSAEPTVPWITVIPASGVVPPGGLTLHATAHTADLPAGANTGSVVITTTSAAGTRLALGNAPPLKVPITVNNIPGVTTKAKNTPPPDALTIPAVASVKNFIVRYQSDVCVTNTSGQAVKYEINFVPTGLPGITEGQSAHVDIASGATLALNDIVATWFGGLSSSGTLEVRPLTDVAASASSAPAGGLENRTTFASSRTFAVTSAGGTYGQYIPAIPYTNFVAQGSVLSLQQIAQSDRYHTNLGLVEGSGEPVSLQVRIFDAAGAKRSDFNVDLTGGQHAQLNDVLKEHGIALDDGRIEVEVTSGAGKVTAYASVIENEVNDPLLVPPVTINGAGSSKWVVPGVAGFSGGSSNWQTDLRIFNSGSDSVDLTLAFYSRSGGAAVTRTTTLAGGEVRQFNHMLSSFFGISQDAGALHVASATAARLVVTARTYNETGQGAYGQFISAVTPEESVAAGSRPLQILQVEESARYRSNIGFAEVSGKAVTLEVSVFQPNHNDASIVEVKLAPNEFRQIDSLLSTLGLPEAYNARISVRVLDGEGRATAYLSLIDMKTGDPTYIPAQ